MGLILYIFRKLPKIVFGGFMRFRFISLVLCLVICLSIIIGCTKRGPVVALIGRKGEISLEELKEDYSRSRSAQALKTAKLPEIRQHLDQMIDNRLKVLAAYEQGLDQDASILARVKSVRGQKLLNKLYERDIIDRVVKESDIREYYARSGREIVIRKITFLYPNPATDEEEEGIKTRAEAVLDKIRSGEDFKKLAREFSEDKGSAMNGGLVMTPLSWSDQKDPLIEEAFSLRLGEVSDVIKNDKGYHIIKVEEIREKEYGHYHEVREEIRQKLITTKKKVISDNARKYWDAVKDKNLIHWNEDGLTFLLAKMQSVEGAGKEVILDSLETLSDEMKNTPLVEFKSGRIIVSDLMERLAAMPGTGRLPWSSTTELKMFLEQWLVAELLIQKAIRKGLDKEYDVVEAVRETMESEMVRMFMNRNVKEKIQVTEEEIFAHYEKNKEDKYFISEKVKAQEVMVKEEALANQVANWARTGRDFTHLAREYTERPGYKKRDGILDYFSRGRWGVVGEKAFALDVGEIAGPIPLDGNRGYSVIKLLGRQPKKIKPYEEVKSRVRSDLMYQTRKAGEEKLLSQMRKINRVHVFDNILEKAFPQDS
jgi:parvulin-like peptidyl-prolyl isomerase